MGFDTATRFKMILDDKIYTVEEVNQFKKLNFKFKKIPHKLNNTSLELYQPLNPKIIFLRFLDDLEPSFDYLINMKYKIIEPRLRNE